MAAFAALFLFLSAPISAEPPSFQRIKSISLLSSLTPADNTAWFSASNTFAFGFHETEDGYAVCIFFGSIRERTVVWTANTEKNPVVPVDVVLVLTGDGLVLQKSDTNDILSRIDNSSQPIAWAAMLDNGNFVLYNANSSVIWQTFDYPTDSLLPGQRLPRGGMLLSRAAKTDFRTGIFRLWMQYDANLVLYYMYGLDTPIDAYFSFETWGLGNNVSLNLENDGRLCLYNGSVWRKSLTAGGNPVTGVIYLVRLDSDGILRVYNRSLEKEDSWKSIWSVTEDKCLPKGLCGINSYCTNTDGGAECRCLPGFDIARKGEWSAGCTSDFKVDCRDTNQSRSYEMRSVANVTWEDNYYSASRGMAEESCKEGCLQDCNCIVALFRDGECRKQKLPLSYGRFSPNATDMAFVRVNTLTHIYPGLTGHRQRLTDVQKRALLGVSLGLLGLLISGIFYYVRRQRGWCNLGKENKQRIDKFVLNHGYLAPKRYSYNEIKKITKSFTEKLGQGGYGVVYKGKLPEGQLVAVKVLKKTHDNAEEFVNEVASISRTSHVNIVNLLGFCYERNNKALVYEFMPNKSLDKFIHKSRSVDPNCSLGWRKMYEIAVGVAQGLEYLHRGCNTRIVHFDIKPQNILLDEDFCPKISDFGLAKLCVKKQSIISMLGTRGTIGYIAPEVFSRNFGVVSHKSDVYSYGIMLLRMAETGTNVENKSSQSSEHYFLEEIYEHVVMQNEKIHALMTEEEEEVVRKMLMVGFWCTQTAPLDRPSMNKVVDMLQGNLQSIQIPPMPFLLSSPKPQLSCSLPVIVETYATPYGLINHYQPRGTLP
ncbi:G-type lectin S-receptor-like serine/threonine-protein kinase LECRK2 [Salvia hispanica]|uniref:G-type lectin S-receptor-like serine/threonine-protein kinase LECRK2 n=1 Tax=Salvia hispanica TaxID=49212 RepID=UPI0020099EFE|nr:G-type lectin S-receptor-like serine/threonine-protein kinase LECRK2 [Salvia hispanica]